MPAVLSQGFDEKTAKTGDFVVKLQSSVDTLDDGV